MTWKAKCRGTVLELCAAILGPSIGLHYVVHLVLVWYADLRPGAHIIVYILGQRWVDGATVVVSHQHHRAITILFRLGDGARRTAGFLR